MALRMDYYFGMRMYNTTSSAPLERLHELARTAMVGAQNQAGHDHGYGVRRIGRLGRECLSFVMHSTAQRKFWRNPR